MEEILTKIDWNVINDYIDKGLLLKQKHPTKNLWILNYSKTCQFDGIWNLITLSARGLVVDEEGSIICRPFKKFFNVDEHEAEGLPDIPTNESFEVFEKMDGSLGILFWYEDEWIVATRGSFISDQAVKAKEILLTKSIINENSMIHNMLDIEYTYLVEIIYKSNRIVLDYGDREDLVLLAAINTKTGDELPYEMLFDYDFDVAKRYDGINDLSKLKGLEEDNKEGFVVRFSSGLRLKIKFEEYVRLHRIVTHVSNKSIWEALKNGDGLSDVIDRVPDEFFNWVKKTERDLLDSFKNTEIEALKLYFDITKSLVRLTDRKEFALKAKDHKLSSILFRMYESKEYDDIIWKMIKPKWTTPFKDNVDVVI